MARLNSGYRLKDGVLSLSKMLMRMYENASGR